MIELTKLNGESFTLNAVMIEQVQSFPDTTITLINGKKIVVQNPETEVKSLMISFYQESSILGSLLKVGAEDE